MFGGFLGGLAVAGAVIAGAAAVHIVSKAYKKGQERRRERMRNEYYNYRNNTYSEINRINSKLNSDRKRLAENARREKARLRAEYIEELKKVNKDMYNKISGILDEELKETENLIKEINEILKNTKETYDKQQNTYVRQKSIKKLIHEMEETRSKLNGYINYLKKYRERRLDYLYNKKGEIAEMFEFSLPDNALYDGKIIYLKKKDISKEGTLKINDSMSNDYICEDIDQIIDFDDEAEIPLLANKIKHSHKFNLSCAKGMFKSMALYQSRIGVEAEVIGFEDKNIKLSYYGLELNLRKSELENPRRIPPRGSKIRVYPMGNRSDLKYTPQVTEKYENSNNEDYYGKIPLVVPNDKIKLFKEYINKHNLMKSDLSWKIGEINEDDENPYLKLQLGTEYVFKCKVVCGQLQYIEFCEIMTKEDLLKMEDIFVDIYANMKVISERNLKHSEELKQNFETFLIYITNEFKEQKYIKENIQGQGYYNKWAEITGKLIEYLSKGKVIRCSILEIEKGKKDYKTGLNTIKVYLNNNEEIIDIIEANYIENHINQFFVEDDNKKKYIAEFSNDATYVTIFGDYEITDLEILDVYIKNIPYPEVVQKHALNLFREGRIANPRLKKALLNGELIEDNDTGDRVKEIFNKSILNNLPQKTAVEKAILQEDIFLIQGPPGTGKTTVIKEIIEQHLQLYPSDKILIVSQANVAVDNVIKGLLSSNNTNITEDDIVRCGNEDSIGEEVKCVLFETKRDSYINSIKKECFTDLQKEKYRKEWIKIIDNKNDISLIGECILKNHQIIGATCVGLEKKKLGLNEMIFDLVIIDEAGKALPGEILIPINRAKKLILIGDHKQLPPVVNPVLYDKEKCNIDDILEKEEKEDFLNESFFKRIFESCPDTNKITLTTQFRMPSKIGTMVSDLFYKEENLKNGENTYDKKPLIFKNPLNILDMSNDKNYKEEKEENSGPYNLRECEVLVNLIKYIREKNYLNRVVVITPYRNQKRHLIRAIRKFNLKNVEINTIDAFQGDECEIVIYCTTRSMKPTQYFSYASRLNVAFSRAKNELIIIGSLKYFKRYGKDHILYKIAEYIKENGQIIDYKTLNIDSEEVSVTDEDECISNERQIKKGAIFEVSIDKIKIRDNFIETPPNKNKVEKVKKFFEENGKLDKAIKIDKQFYLKDGYSRYLAAKDLNLSSILVKID